MVRRVRLGRSLIGPVLFVAASGGVLVAVQPAGAADPIVLGSCAGSVQGSPGQAIMLKPTAVLQPVTDALAPLDPLGVLRRQVGSLWTTLPPIPIGAVAARPGSISGDAIGDAVIGRLRTVPFVAPLVGLIAGPLDATLTKSCGLTTTPSPPTMAGPGSPAPTGSVPSSAPTTRPMPRSPHAGVETSPAGSTDKPTPASEVNGGGVPPDEVAYHLGVDGVAGAASVPPEGLAFRLDPGNVPSGAGSVQPESAMTLAVTPPPQYMVMGPTQGAKPGTTGTGTTGTETAQPVYTLESARSKVRLPLAFAALVLASALAQIARSWALRSSRRGK